MLQGYSWIKAYEGEWTFPLKPRPVAIPRHITVLPAPKFPIRPTVSPGRSCRLKDMAHSKVSASELEIISLIPSLQGLLLGRQSNEWHQQFLNGQAASNHLAFELRYKVLEFVGVDEIVMVLGNGIG